MNLSKLGFHHQKVDIRCQHTGFLEIDYLNFKYFKDNNKFWKFSLSNNFKVYSVFKNTYNLMRQFWSAVVSVLGILFDGENWVLIIIFCIG